MMPVISFKNVSFSYNKNRQILDNINFELRTQVNHLAIIGESGLGKTTLLKIG